MSLAIDSSESSKWFIVLLAQIAGAVFGTLIPKAVGTTITHALKNEAWNECMVVHQFAYFGFYASLLTAKPLKEPFTDLGFLFMVLTLVFFGVGLILIRAEKVDHLGILKPAGQLGFVKANIWFTSFSFVVTVLVIIFLQYLKAPLLIPLSTPVKAN